MRGGTGHPTVVLLPGMLCSARLWRDQVRQLGGVADLEVLELTADSVDGMAAQVVALPHPRVVLVGLSLGAIVAMTVARIAPDRVAALGLLSANARPPRPEQRTAWAEMSDRTRAGEFSSITSQTLLPQLVHPARRHDTALTATVEAMAEDVGPTVFLRQLAAQRSRVDLRPGLRGLRCPTLLIAGDGDPLTSVAGHREIADLVGEAHVHVLPGTGHLGPLEVPAAVTALLGGWLAHDL